MGVSMEMPPFNHDIAGCPWCEYLSGGTDDRIAS